MQKIHVKSLPLKDVVTDIARELKTEVYQDCDEYCVTLPSRAGEGVIRGINFSGGLGIIIYDCTFRENTEIRFTVSQVHPAKFIYCIEGELYHCFQESDDGPHKLNQYESAIVASSHENGHVLTFTGKKKTRMSSLEILRSEFKSKLECDLAKLDDELKDLFEDENAQKKFFSQGSYSLSLDDLFTQMENFEGKGILRKLFLEGKAYDMLTQQIVLYEDGRKDQRSQVFIRKAEIEAIKEAVSFIEDNLQETITVEQLSRKVGVNANKLQNGFKLLKGTTVNGFLKETRLASARRLLHSSEMNISEIVYKVGLSNRGYFSKIFKERYGVSPSEFRAEYNPFESHK